jgi:hypothetical protein
MFSYCAAFSCAMFVACLGLWICSQWLPVGIQWTHIETPTSMPFHYGGTYLVADPGGILLVRHVFSTTNPTEISSVGAAMSGRPAWELGLGTQLVHHHYRSVLDQTGFYYVSPRPNLPSQPNVMMSEVRVPDWPLLILFSFLPVLWLLHRVRRRPTEGICRVCGYDLRATRDRCPECGAIPEGAKGAAT